ncbi:hypothetical protein BASA62_008151 [Batrachochytrium salamandrivorans]|nr:hypothetical protein BASA62_008151 [Batrachochytrium salamandrivorans]
MDTDVEEQSGTDVSESESYSSRRLRVRKKTDYAALNTGSPRRRTPSAGLNLTDATGRDKARRSSISSNASHVSSSSRRSALSNVTMETSPSSTSPTTPTALHFSRNIFDGIGGQSDLLSSSINAATTMRPASTSVQTASAWSRLSNSNNGIHNTSSGSLSTPLSASTFNPRADRSSTAANYMSFEESLSKNDSLTSTKETPGLRRGSDATMTPRTRNRQTGQSWLGRIAMTSNEVELDYGSDQDSDESSPGERHTTFPDIFAEEAILEEPGAFLQFIDWLSDLWIIQIFIPIFSWIASVVALVIWGVAALCWNVLYYLCGQPLLYICWAMAITIGKVVSFCIGLFRHHRNVWLAGILGILGVYLVTTKPGVHVDFYSPVNLYKSSPTLHSLFSSNISIILERIYGALPSNEYEDTMQDDVSPIASNAAAGADRNLEIKLGRLEKRIAHVEQKLRVVSTGLSEATGDMKKQYSKLRGLIKEASIDHESSSTALLEKMRDMSDQLTKLDSRIEKSDRAMEHTTLDHARQLELVTTLMDSYKTDVMELDSQIKSNRQGLTDSDVALSKTVARLDLLFASINELDRKIQEYGDTDHIVERVLHTIKTQADLPGFLVARRSATTGEIELPPDLWKAIESRLSGLASHNHAEESTLVDGPLTEGSKERLKSFILLQIEDAHMRWAGLADMDQRIQTALDTALGDGQHESLKSRLDHQIENLHALLTTRADKLDALIHDTREQLAADLSVGGLNSHTLTSRLQDLEQQVHDHQNLLRDVSAEQERIKGVQLAQQQERQAELKKPNLSLDWDDFIQHNRQELAAITSAEIDAYIETKVILTRQQTLTMIESKIRSITSQTDHDISELTERINKLDVGSTPSHSHSDGPTLSQDAIEVLIHRVVASALEDYRADVLAIPDYALRSAGARVVSDLTSSTFSESFKPEFLNRLAKVVDVRKTSGQFPATALSQDISPGNCWAMAGSSGTLGIYLAESIIPTDITIEHSPIQTSIGNRHKSAPRHFELWAVFDVKAFASLDLSSDVVRRRVLPMRPDTLSNKRPAPPAGVLLGDFEFDPVKNSMRVYPLHRVLDIRVATVVVRFKSNWGHPNWTCIYRVRIHGRE